MTGVTGAELKICLSGDDSGIANSMFAHSVTGIHAHDAFLENQKHWLSEQIAGLAETGAKVSSVVSWAHSTAEDMLTQIADFAPDIVMKDAYRESALHHRPGLPPTDRQLLSECRSPLLLVGAAAQPVPKRVVAAIDIDDRRAGADALNDKIISHAVKLAALNSAEVHIAAASRPQSQLPAGSASVASRNDTAQDGRQALLAKAAAHGIPEQRTHWLLGHADREIPDLVNRHAADILVIGSTYRTTQDGKGLGSTAEALLQGSACDVMTVKPD